MDRQDGEQQTALDAADAEPQVMKEHLMATVRFQISYFTSWGQNVKVLGSGQHFGDWDPQRALAMACHHEGDNPCEAGHENLFTLSCPCRRTGKEMP